VRWLSTFEVQDFQGNNYEGLLVYVTSNNSWVVRGTLPFANHQETETWRCHVPMETYEMIISISDVDILRSKAHWADAAPSFLGAS